MSLLQDLLKKKKDVQGEETEEDMPTLLEAFEQSFSNPMQSVAWNAVKSSVTKKIKEDIEMGGDPGQILDKHGVQNPEQAQQQQQGFKPGIGPALMMGGAGLQGQNPAAILESLIKASGQQQTKGVYGFDPSTRQLSQVGEVPTSADVRNVMPQLDMGGMGETEVPEGMEIKGYDYKYGKMIPRFGKIQPGVMEKEIEKSKAKMQQSKISSQHNLELVSGAAKDLSEWLVRAYGEGGAGSVYQAGITALARKGVLPPAIANKFAASGAVVGKRNEMLLKMFPMLTQQLGKEGSIRLIESVLERIGQTLPDTATPPGLAKEQLVGTLQSMYRINRAVNLIDLEQLSPETMPAFVNLISDAAARIEFDEDEQSGLDKFITNSLKPLDKYLGKQTSTTNQSGWTKEKESRYQELLKKRGK